MGKDYSDQPFAWKGAKQKLEEQKKAQQERLKQIQEQMGTPAKKEKK